MITSEPLVEVAVRQFRNRARRFLQFRFSRVGCSPGFGRGIRQNQKQNLSAKERSFTELRFASFLAPLCVSNFLLDMADDFIDGL
jgi:hypothetical protein